MLNLDNLKVKLQKVDWFAVAVLLFSTSMMLSYSSIFVIPAIVDNLLSGVAALICLYLFAIGNKDKKYFVAIGITVLLGISTLLHRNLAMFITWFTIIGLQNRSFTKFVRTMFYSQLFWMLFISLGSLVYYFAGMHDLIFTDRFTYVSYNFGFLHSNTFSILVFQILMLWLWLKYETLNFKDYAIGAGVILFAFYFAQTKTFLLAGIALLAIIFISKIKHRYIENIIRLGVMNLFWIISIIILVFSTYFHTDNSIINAVNVLLTDRLRLSGYASHHFGLTFIGQYVDFSLVSWEPVYRLDAFTFDNLYAFMLYNLGFIWIILTSIALAILSLKLKVKDLVFLIVWLLYSITEGIAVNGYFGFPVFFIAYVFFNYQSDEQVGELAQKILKWYNNQIVKFKKQ